MKTYLDCYPCFLRQALSAARQADASVELQRHILLETMDQLRDLPAQATPPVMAEIIHRTVRRETHTPDPYARSKRDATAQAMALLPGLRERVRGAPDPLETAVRIAIAGNIIDNGSDAPGTLLEHCSAAFREKFAQAPLILAKGQANYETLSETQAPVFFLLQAKCPVIADDLGVPVGSVVLKACSNSRTDSP